MPLTTKKTVRRRPQMQKYIWPALAVVGAATIAKGEGFRNPTIGTSDLGQSGGRIAQVGDATAVQQNPANLVNITNITAEATPSVVYIKANFQSSVAPQTASTEHPVKVLPNIFVTAPIESNKIAVGLGVTVPYGLANQWNDSSAAFTPGTGVLRYTAPYYSELETINLNPSVSFRLLDNLSIGVGFDAMWSDIRLKQYYPSFLLGGAGDSHLKADGDGWGWGGNLGITWDITEHQHVAVTYRSQMDVDYRGHFTVDNISGEEAFLGATSSSSFNSSINFPNIVAVGYGIDITDTIQVESDFEWLEFSRFKSLNLNTGNNSVLFSTLGQSTNIRENWHNTFTAGIGGNWKFADNWVLRAGYQYFESPVPNSTFSPTIPDANQNVITLGIGWSGKHNSIEASYGLDFYNDRHIGNDYQPAFDGKYSFNVHLFSLAYRFSF